MATVIEQVLVFCQEDEQLNSLAYDHPLLLKALEQVPSLSVADVLSILAAVENEQYQLVQEVELKESQSLQEFEESGRPSKGFKNEERGMYVEDLLGCLMRADEVNQALHKRILEFSKSTQELAVVVERSAFTDDSRYEALKRASYSLQEELDRKAEEVDDLKERNDFLAQELAVYLQSGPRLKTNADELSRKLNRLKKEWGLMQKQNAELQAEVKERQTLVKSNSSLRQKLMTTEAKLKTSTEAASKIDPKPSQGRRLSLLVRSIVKRTLSKALHMWSNHTKPTKAKMNELKNRSKALFASLLSCVYSHFSLNPLVLRLRGSCISIQWLQMLLDSCSGDLLELDLSDCYLKDQGIGLVLNWIHKGCRVQRLLLRNNSLTTEITSELLGLSGLTTLDLSQNEIGYSLLNPDLLDIRLSRCGLTGSWLSDFLSMIQDLKLQRLDLSFNSITQGNVRECLEKLPLGKLKSLNLSGWPITDNHCSQLISVLSENPNLEDVHLAQVALSQSSFDSIIARLRSLSGLSSVDLSKCKVKIDSVCRLIQGCGSLRKVILKDLVFTPSEYKALVKAIEVGTHLEVCLVDSK